MFDLFNVYSYLVSSFVFCFLFFCMQANSIRNVSPCLGRLTALTALNLCQNRLVAVRFTLLSVWSLSSCLRVCARVCVCVCVCVCICLLACTDTV